MKWSKVRPILAGLILLPLWVSCTLDDRISQFDFTYELSPIRMVDMPDTLVYGRQYMIDIGYENQTDCYSFSGFDFALDADGDEHQRIISVVSSVIIDEEKCKDYEEPVLRVRALEFDVRRDDYYILKFWQGTDSLGQPEYLTKEIIVKRSVVEL